MLEDGERIVTILAVTAAGIWAYFNFVKGRVYHPRLETQVEGSLSAQGEFSLLIATYALKNVGLAKVPIEQKGSALRVLAATTVNDSAEVTWNRLDTFPVLENHKWIEPSEAIEEQQLVRLPRRGYLAFRLELRVVSRKKEWNAMTIVGCHSSRGVATEETSRSE